MRLHPRRKNRPVIQPALSDRLRVGLSSIVMSNGARLVYSPLMHPRHVWVTDGTELLNTFLVVGTVLAIAIAYAAWRGKPKNFNPERYGIACVGSGVAAFLLFGLANWMNADVIAAVNFLLLAFVLLGGLLFGVLVGRFLSVLPRVWRWHKATRLAGRLPRSMMVGVTSPSRT